MDDDARLRERALRAGRCAPAQDALELLTEDLVLALERRLRPAKAPPLRAVPLGDEAVDRAPVAEQAERVGLALPTSLGLPRGCKRLHQVGEEGGEVVLKLSVRQ